MSKEVILAAVLCLALASSAVGRAPSNSAIWLVSGTGSLTCGKWVLARENKDEDQVRLFLQWVSGWVVSYNYYIAPTTTKNRAATPDFDTTTAFLDKFCRDRPLVAVALGAAELVEQSGGKKALHNRPQPSIE